MVNTINNLRLTMQTHVRHTQDGKDFMSISILVPYYPLCGSMELMNFAIYIWRSLTGQEYIMPLFSWRQPAIDRRQLENDSNGSQLSAYIYQLCQLASALLLLPPLPVKKVDFLCCCCTNKHTKYRHQQHQQQTPFLYSYMLHPEDRHAYIM